MLLPNSAAGPARLGLPGGTNPIRILCKKRISAGLWVAIGRDRDYSALGGRTLFPRLLDAAYLTLWEMDAAPGQFFFGLYHVWQLHGFPTVFLVGVVLGYVVWWKKDIRLSISGHVFSNAIGRLMFLMFALTM